MKIRKYTIGRSFDNDEVINEPDVSSHHAIIYVMGNVVSIDDLNSSNGTYHNGYRIKTTVLKKNSEVKIANRYPINLAPFFEDYNSDFQLDADNNYIRQFNDLETVWNDKEEKKQKLEKMTKFNNFLTRTALYVIPCIAISFFVDRTYYMPISLVLGTITNSISLGVGSLKRKDKALDVQFKCKYKCPRCGVQLYEDWQILKNQKECFHCKATWAL